MEREYHEFANIYPLLEGEAFDQMKWDIQAHGLRLPIILAPDGRILDGRNRYRACCEVGVEPRFEDYDGDESPQEMLRYVVSLNGPRRHLDSGQQAACAVEASDILTKLIVDAAGREKAGKSKDGIAGGRGRKKNPPQKIGEGLNGDDSHAGESIQQIAEMFGTNRQYVSDAQKVRDASPQLFQQVKNGEVKLTAAKREISNHKPREPQEFEVYAATESMQASVRKLGEKWPKEFHKVFASKLRSVAKEFDQ